MGKKSEYRGRRRSWLRWDSPSNTGRCWLAGKSLYPNLERSKNEHHTQDLHLILELGPCWAGGGSRRQSGATRSCSPWARCGQSLFYPTCAAFLCIAQVSLGVIKAITLNFSSPQSNWGQFLASPGAFGEPKVALLMIFLLEVSAQVWLR